jgi:Zn-dependent metalloprotease
LLISAVLLFSFTACSEKQDKDRIGCLTCPEENPAAKAAREYIEQHKSDFGLRDQLDEMLICDVQEEQLGMTHVRFNQHYRGVFVVGGELIVHLNPNLTVSSVSGRTIPGITIDTRYQIEPRDALLTALNDFIADGDVDLSFDLGKLAVLREQNSDYLCWDFKIRSETQLMAREYFIDAVIGDIITYHDL